ncbi:TolC family outer membrane protein [Cellvibrio sp. KY-YJ-3]|uniref:TolC family outer membrane protein n=1 Tax=Cellvibrio sp. KY-YJ-3 TaxID=454662 RepID=UPI00124945D1|nr:TolC family outer membrane protein [Cellvibrio sp. KY-YJ-3]QEY12471.1 secretion protein [Cellvibrio sp. KY-YJ-3]
MKKTKLYLLVSLFSLTPFTASANSLLDVYELALQNDAQLKADRAKYEAGLENKTIARSNLLPQINANAQISNSDIETTDNLTNTSLKNDTDGKSWEVSLSQPLFNMSYWYSYKQGGKLSEQAEAQYGADQQSLIVRVAEAYFNVLRSVETLEATIAEEKALAKQLEQTKQRFDVGLTAITEVHEAQAAFDSARAATLVARGNLSINYEALEVLTGKPEDQVAPLSPKFPVVAPTPSNRADWVEFSLQNNYNLKASKLQADASLQFAKANKSGHLPTLGANLGYSDSESDSDNGGQTGGPSDISRNGTTISLRLDVPIYSGGATSGRSRQAYAQYTQAQELYNSTQRNVIQNTRALHLSVETDVANVQARKQAIVSNQSALEATQSGYEVGTRNLVEVLLAQRNLYQARRNYSDALYTYVINTIKLREVAGMLTPADVQEIDKWLLDDALVNRSQYEN